MHIYWSGFVSPASTCGTELPRVTARIVHATTSTREEGENTNGKMRVRVIEEQKREYMGLSSGLLPSKQNAQPNS